MKGKEHLRFCLYAGAVGVTEVDHRFNSGINGRGPRYFGPLAEAFNLWVEVIFGRDRLNYTSVVKPSIGIFNLTSGFYDDESCLHSMQMNKSDFAIGFTNHPVVGESLKYLPPYISDNIYIFSRYIVSNEVRAADFMSAFVYVYSSKVWILSLLFVFAFWMLFKLHMKLLNRSVPSRKRTRDNSLYRVLMQIFSVEYIKSSTLSMKVVSIFMTLLSFYVLKYFTLSMKTDIIVVAEPVILNTYDDLLAKPRLKVIFPAMVDNFARFQSADENSKEKKLWLHSLKEVGGDWHQMVFEMSKTNMIDKSTLVESMVFDSKVEFVGLLSELTKGGARCSCCLLKVVAMYRRGLSADKKQALNFYSWLSKVKEAKEYILCRAHSVSYQTPYLAKIYKRSRRANDLGIVGMFLLKLDRPMIDVVKIESRQEGDTYRDCLADNYRDNMPQVSPAAFSVIQFKTLAYICAGLIALAVYVLFCERKRKLNQQVHRRLRQQLIRFRRTHKT